MSVFLDRIDAAPIIYSDFDAQFLQWIAVLVDTLNEAFTDMSDLLVSIDTVSGTTQKVVNNSAYIPTNVAQTVFQLPPVASVGSAPNTPVGSILEIDGQGAGGWKILTSAGQTIQVASVGATATTSITSASRYDSIIIKCVVADTTWITISSQTTGFAIV